MITHLAEGDAEDINRAVAAARKAFDEGPWPKMTAYVTSSAALPPLFPIFMLSLTLKYCKFDNHLHTFAFDFCWVFRREHESF